MSKQKNGKIVMDINKILDFIFAPNEKRNTDVELEETFLQGEEKNNGQLGLVQRIKHESKSGEHAQHEAIRVNLITRLLDTIDELDTNNGDDSFEMTFGEEVAYNTLFNEGFLKMI